MKFKTKKLAITQGQPSPTSTKRWHVMNKTVKTTLSAILLSMAAGAIFAIVPAAFAQNEDQGYGFVNGTIGPQGPDAVCVPGIAEGAIFAIGVPAGFAKDAVRPINLVGPFEGVYTYSEDGIRFDYPSATDSNNGYLPYNFRPAANQKAQWQTLWYQLLFLDWLQKNGKSASELAACTALLVAWLVFALNRLRQRQKTLKGFSILKRSR
jgi:hypothetical protein